MKKVFVLLACVLPLSCADPLKGKSPYWYNGYVYGTQGYSFFAQGRLDIAAASYKKALAEAQRFDIPQQTAQYTFNIGRCFFELGVGDSALDYFKRSHTGFVFCNDTAAAGQACAYIALAYSKRGQTDSAMQWYAKGALVNPPQNERPFWISVHGRLLWQRDHCKEALNYFEEACALYKKQKAYGAMARMHYCRAEVYRAFGDYPEAKNCIKEALFWSDKSELRYDRFRTVLAAASLCSCVGDFAGAQWYYQRAHQCAPSGVHLPTMEVIEDCSKPLY